MLGSDKQKHENITPLLLYRLHKGIHKPIHS